VFSKKLVAPADGHHVKTDLAKSIAVEDRAGFFIVSYTVRQSMSWNFFPFRRDDDRVAVGLELAFLLTHWQCSILALESTPVRANLKVWCVLACPVRVAL